MWRFARMGATGWPATARALRGGAGRVWHLARLGGLGGSRPPQLESFTRFLYGLTGYEFARHAVEMRHHLEAVFMVVTFGDLVGVPILPPVYSLRLLPHVVPEIATWKRHLVRRKEFWEKEEYDLHGL